MSLTRMLYFLTAGREDVTPAHLPTEICCLKVEYKPSVVTVDSTSRNGVGKQICLCFCAWSLKKNDIN